MSGVHSDTCLTCTCQAPGPYCSATVTRLHETFNCLELPNHPMPHKGMLVPPPCPECSGLEEHIDGCAHIGFFDDKHDWFEVQWDDGDSEPRLVPRGPEAQK